MAGASRFTEDALPNLQNNVFLYIFIEEKARESYNSGIADVCRLATITAITAITAITRQTMYIVYGYI